MTYEPETPFDSIEGAQEYVGLLSEAMEEARAAIEQDIVLARGEDAPRRLEALLLVSRKLDRLRLHLVASRCVLNDLRTLRRLLLNERAGKLGTRSPAAPEEARWRAPSPARPKPEGGFLEL